MADLYPNQSATNSYPPQSSYHHRPQDSQPHHQYHLSSPTVVYPPRLISSSQSSPDGTPSHNSPPKSDSAAHSPQPQQNQQPQPQPQQQPQQQQQQNNLSKTDTKPQATFLTKLYALLERPENHHMIRWDPAGEHIIVERPEQLALHVLPSIYRQSRFASFSRQLNIYGFMRKVNLRNVDPAIDDPDASTWSHPTLNRHSPPEVVANFKRRVPPRLPKPRKRPDAEQNPVIPSPRSASGLGAVPLTIPSSLGLTSSPKGGRARGFSAPGSYQPLPQPGNTGQWGNTYPRPLPPLTVPSDPPLSHGSVYTSQHALHPVSPADDHGNFSSLHYSSNRDVMVPSSNTYSYPEQNNWSFSPVSSGSSSSHSGSLTSLLNPPSNGSTYPPTRPTINTSYPSSLSSVSMQHSASSLSPDSRPATGYSVSSMSSLPYDDNHHYSNDYSRPSSGHHRPITPTSSRPPSSKSSYAHSTLSVRRQRRHSQAVNPYPAPYEQHLDNRPSSSPQPGNGEDHALHRSRSMIQLPTVETYNHYGSNHPDFAYSAGPLGSVGAGGAGAPLDQTMDDWNSRSVRPSTSASSLSAASQTSSSQAHTPPVTDNFEDPSVHRCE
ncbi:HSF-type DNA-binding-domain-containing protein [Lactarius vividus]|nr:HSF-type DNA-binding-domain-containing protein [Lactarius vividus]